MTWSDFYLFCFIVGFALSLVSFVAGAVHLTLPCHLHTDVPGAHHGGGFIKGAPPVAHGHAATGTAHQGSSASDGYLSWLNASTAMAFLAWFGGTVGDSGRLVGVPIHGQAHGRQRVPTARCRLSPGRLGGDHQHFHSAA